MKNPYILYDDVPLCDVKLADCLTYGQRHIPVVFCKSDEKIWYVTTLLNRHLESYVDGIIVTERGRPTGVIDGREWIAHFLKDPTKEFFQNKAGTIAMTDEILLYNDIDISTLFRKWKNSRRCVAVLNSEDHYSSLSLRTLLEVITLSKTNLTLSNIESKKRLTISKDSKIGDALKMMLQNRVRRLVVEETHNIFTDRTAIDETVSYHFLKNSENILEKTISNTKTGVMCEIKQDLLLSEASRILAMREYPCIEYNDSIITPWDILDTALKF